MFRFLCLFFLLAFSIFVRAQGIKGIVYSEEKPIEGVLIVINEGAMVTNSDESGRFSFDKVSYPLRLKLKLTGYLTIDTLLNKESSALVKLQLIPDPLLLNEVVVTGTRSEMNRQLAPVMVQRLDTRLLERAQAASIAEGLAYTPGLRVENNCQNCGFTQIRLNGLSGPYTQILLNGRPVFSALAGVYGLEQFPASMIDRVEVVRGGGSALYGGNAIAGTVNIITKEPLDDRMEASTTLLVLPGGRIDHRQSLYAATRFGKSGLSVYAGNRARQWWDANGDGLSEVTSLSLQNIGLSAFHDLNSQNRLTFDLSLTREQRRGGSDFDRAPHQARIAEALGHLNSGVSFAWEYRNLNRQERLTFYSSLRHIDRDSYYGAGGRVLQPTDTLTPTDILAINAYGQTQDWALAQGFQWNRSLLSNVKIIAGAEWQWMKVRDEMPGYQRLINQRSTTIGQYMQVQWEANSRLSLLVGGRLDYIDFKGITTLGLFSMEPKDSRWVAVPRISLLYKHRENWKFRLGYAEGYRTSQVFDEDLHIESVGGTARFIKFSPDIKPEYARSITASADWTRTRRQSQWNWQSEFFLTRLENPFLYSGATEENGYSVQWKRNGSGATVMGLHQEWRWAPGSQFQLQAGVTMQTSRFMVQEIIWEDAGLNELPAVSTAVMIRNPDVYGFGTAEWKPKNWTLSFNLQYTGPMTVPHVTGMPNRMLTPSDAREQFTQLVRTRDFWDIGFRAGRSWNAGGHYKLSVFLTAANLLNSFQQDFDIGTSRDAAYVYGPLRPRNWGFTLQLAHR